MPPLSMPAGASAHASLFTDISLVKFNEDPISIFLREVANRQADRQTGRQAGRQADRQTDKRCVKHNVLGGGKNHDTTAVSIAVDRHRYFVCESNFTDVRPFQ